jgi:anti-repressor protein
MTEEQEGKQTVNARELHEFLGVGTEFSHWTKRRIDTYGFLEGEDFLTNVKKDGRQLFKEYHISLDMAKELSMVENNDKGREARRYFIQVEKEHQQLSKALIACDPTVHFKAFRS